MTLWLACGPDPGADPGGPTSSTDTSPPEPWATAQDSAIPSADTALPPPSNWADVVVDAPATDALPFGDPALAVNGARGAGALAGGSDVFSLDADGDGAHLTVSWSGRRLVDGPGVDLVVFENAFDVAPGVRFMDPAVVEVSADGQAFVAFPVAYGAADPAAWSADPTHWEGFAGRSPVLLHVESNAVDPFDAALAGGDGFDLADLPVTLADVVAVRITSATAVVDPATGAPYPHDPVANGADVDAVYGRTLVWD